MKAKTDISCVVKQVLRQERSGHNSFGREQNFVSCCDIQCQNLTRHCTTTTATTIRHHLEKYRDENEEIVDNVIKSLYCDDFVSFFDSEEEAFAQYSKLKDFFNDAGLNLRKWKSNIEDLMEKIVNVENNIEQDKGDEKVL